MKVHEYQAKALLREFGVAVPKGEVADTPAQARAIAQRLGAAHLALPRNLRSSHTTGS